MNLRNIRFGIVLLLCLSAVSVINCGFWDIVKYLTGYGKQEGHVSNDQVRDESILINAIVQPIGNELIDQVEINQPIYTLNIDKEAVNALNNKYVSRQPSAPSFGQVVCPLTHALIQQNRQLQMPQPQVACIGRCVLCNKQKAPSELHEYHNSVYCVDCIEQQKQAFDRQPVAAPVSSCMVCNVYCGVHHLINVEDMWVCGRCLQEQTDASDRFNSRRAARQPQRPVSFECSICFEDRSLNQAQWFACAHKVCKGCFGQTDARGNRCIVECPECRTPIQG